MKCGTYMFFDSVEAAAIAGYKMCARIFVPDLVWDLYASALIVTEIPIIFSWPWYAVQSICHIAQNLAKWRPFCIKKHIFALFSKSVWDISTKFGRDIAWGKWNLVQDYDLK